MSMQWRDGMVVSLQIDFPKWHPWLLGQSELTSGYFTAYPGGRTSSRISSETVSLLIVAPNLLKPIADAGIVRDKCFSVESARMLATHGQEHKVRVAIHSFPCSLRFCSEVLEEDFCLSHKTGIDHINNVVYTQLK